MRDVFKYDQLNGGYVNKNAVNILIVNIRTAFEAVEGGFEPPRGS
jgi:hypothetical protein